MIARNQIPWNFLEQDQEYDFQESNSQEFNTWSNFIPVFEKSYAGNFNFGNLSKSTFSFFNDCQESKIPIG